MFSRRWLLAACMCASTLWAGPASATTVVVVLENGTLGRYNTATGVLDFGTVTGLIGGEQLLAIDFRPLTGRLYGVGASHLYVLDLTTNPSITAWPMWRSRTTIQRRIKPRRSRSTRPRISSCASATS